MIRSLKEIKRQMDARAHSDEIVRDEEGRAVIEMTVLRDEDFLSDYSAGKRPVVSASVAEFLEENARAFLPKEPVCIRIHSDCIDSEEEKAYTKALREYYVRHYTENRRDLKRNAFVSFLMAVIGLIALSVAITVSFFPEIALLSEATDIFAWVFLWEAVDLFFLQRKVLKMERNRCLRFLDAKIIYLPLARGERD